MSWPPPLSAAHAAAIAEDRARGGKLSGANLFGWIVGAGVGGLGIVVAVAMALTSALPSSAMWTGGIVCESRYHLEYSFSSIGFSGGRDTHFHCVSDVGSYDASGWAIYALQHVLVALVRSAVFAMGLLTWRRLRSRN